MKPNDIVSICDVLKQEKSNSSTAIKSIRFSNSTLIGDIGSSALASSLPLSICEIGLVNRDIGDKGGNEMLHCIKTVSNLNMICIEQNNFSDKLKMEFKAFKENNPNIILVI